jgi:Fe-S-cluster containining protein
VYRLNDNDLIQWNQQHAFTGKLGSSRESFCKNFLQAKNDLVKDILADQLREAEENGNEITCRKGCLHSTCCMEHTEATLQECDAIVYYLYGHQDILTKFIANYSTWKDKLLLNPQPYQQLEELYSDLYDPRQKEMKSFAALAEFDRAYLDTHVRYFDLHLPCPFLVNNECSIYEARPYACVSSYSTAPLDLCAIDQQILPPISRSTPPDETLNSTFFYREIINPRPQFMPMTVHDILINGYEYLAKTAGLDDLEHEARVEHLVYRP